MPAAKFRKSLLVVVLLIGVVIAFVFSTKRETINFSVQVKPIFNKKCITCHGGVKKQAGFSLLFRDDALAKTESGKYAIVPGDPEASEMIRRINLKDEEERMPYQHEPLSETEIGILRRWIKQGAKWGEHWAYVPVEKVEVPQPQSSFLGLMPAKKWDWVKNDIDHFIYKKLQELELKPSAEADKATLLRRACLDLTGLPPSSALAEKFLKDDNSNAYEILIDSLLASPHFGERWTAVWMDLARYADTKGYERDTRRSIWRYRDWLIRAFNEDKPYNEFLIAQLAGDLLPGASDEQFIATAFHRNTMTNDEGGTDNEEFRTAAVVDRVNTTWEALMGTTFGCVQCHSHPYDPFRHEEYYRFMAFFNNSRDEDTWADYPAVRHYDEKDSLKRIGIVNWLNKYGYEQKAKEVDLFLRTWQPAYNSLITDSFINCELNDTKWLAMRHSSIARLKQVDLENKDQLIFRYIGYKQGGILAIHLNSRTGPLLKRLVIPKTKDWSVMKIDFPLQSGIQDLYFDYQNPSLKPNVSGIQFDWFYFTNALPGRNNPGYDSAEKHFRDLMGKNVPSTPVMMDNPPGMFRKTYVFERGNWLVKGTEVQPDVPRSLNSFPKNAPHNRLGLALWLTDKKNPLTARTMVNRLWEQLFGTGLVETVEDLGTQGIEPTNRQLLDCLSYKFMYEYNWSVKKLLKEIVLSAAYRQDSRISKEALEKDPFNKYFSRGARVRLSAEQVRDQALFIGDLLSEKMYGPGVMPWQPDGIWLSPWNGEYWKKSEGENQYRRALYTYWKRTAPYPSMITFDGVMREVCTSRRIRTNTPLQALVTLNDSVYLEASRHLAYAVEQRMPQGNIRERISKAYEKALFKPISQAKLDALENLYNEALKKFRSDADKTCEMIGEMNEHNKPGTAALVVVMNALLNLDEIITKS